MILSKIFFFKNSEESDISPQIIEFKNLEDSAVIFQALETSPASLMSVAWQPHWPQQPLKPNLLKKLPDPDGLMITGTKITITVNFLWNGSSKIQFFTKTWRLFCRRPLRLLEVKKVSNGGSGINSHYSGSH